MFYSLRVSSLGGGLYMARKSTRNTVSVSVKDGLKCIAFKPVYFYLKGGTL